MRLAHFSDIHATLAPYRAPLRALHPKRVLGTGNWLVGGRWHHFGTAAQRIRALLADVDRQAVDHALCTGDVTLMSFEEEFAAAAALFGDRLSRPERYTAIAGNHDRYTARALEERVFERHFGAIAPAGEYPHLKRLAEGVVLVLLDVCRPTLFASSGMLGEGQLARLEVILTDPALRQEYVILALHYGLLRENGRRDRRSHRIVDDQALLALLGREEVRADLILHGHMHNSYSVNIGRRTIVCAGSATDLALRCGYNVYSLDVDRKSLQIERRFWSAARATYAPLFELERSEP